VLTLGFLGWFVWAAIIVGVKELQNQPVSESFMAQFQLSLGAMFGYIASMIEFYVEKLGSKN